MPETFHLLSLIAEKQKSGFVENVQSFFLVVEKPERRCPFLDRTFNAKLPRGKKGSTWGEKKNCFIILTFQPFRNYPLNSLKLTPYVRYLMILRCQNHEKLYLYFVQKKPTKIGKNSLTKIAFLDIVRKIISSSRRVFSVVLPHNFPQKSKPWPLSTKFSLLTSKKDINVISIA